MCSWFGYVSIEKIRFIPIRPIQLTALSRFETRKMPDILTFWVYTVFTFAVFKSWPHAWLPLLRNTHHLRSELRSEVRKSHTAFNRVFSASRLKTRKPWASTNRCPSSCRCTRLPSKPLFSSSGSTTSSRARRNETSRAAGAALARLKSPWWNKLYRSIPMRSFIPNTRMHYSNLNLVILIL